MKKITAIFFSVLLCFAAGSYAVTPGAAPEAKIKNVILLIPAGMSPQAAALTRLYKGKKLNLDSYACGLVRTYQADGPVTDSAAAGTAMATGFKTSTGFISCLPEKAGMPGVVLNSALKKSPVATILEAAKFAGKSTGIVCTSNIQNASAACFTSHYPDIGACEIIAEQQVYLGPDVVLGGGSSCLGSRKDNEDLIAVIEKAGYDYVVWPGRMRTSNSPKLWGMFAPKDLKHEFDRNKDAEPSLAEMTEKAIEVLSKNPNGFFLMVEGSKIDRAAGANDPMGVVSDVLSFDAAAGIAFAFAENNMDTVVIAAANHCTGGLSIGASEAHEGTALQSYTGPLKKARFTGEGLFKQLFKDRSNLKQVMKDYFGITGLTAWEEASLIVAPPDKFNYAAGPIISNRAHISWATDGITGDDTVLYCFDPRGKNPTGVIENTRIASYMEEALGLDLKAATAELFVPVSGLGTSITAKPSFADAENPVLELAKGGKKISLPMNKNIIQNGSKIRQFTGITVYNGSDWYIPAAAVKLTEEMLK